MSRIYLSRGARGMLVTEAQQNLQRDGYYTGTIDAIYGGVTEKGVFRYQEDQQLPITGALDSTTWIELMRRGPPSLYQRCLQITAAFEGHGFGSVAGAWDAGWVTWGIIGFTLSSGSLGKVILGVWGQAPEVVREAFGNRTDELVSIMRSSRLEQNTWAESISVPPTKYRVVEPWRSGFMAFGQSPVVQVAQINNAEQQYFTPAMQSLSRLGLTQELGASLCFDIQVQNGGIKPEAMAIIEQFRQSHPIANEQDLRAVIADAVADASSPRFKEDVRRRKRTFVTGVGNVHGSAYVLSQWGVNSLPI
jgi:peptidoglycan hydrolase-like protein with peptidoglycan-binding domain